MEITQLQFDILVYIEQAQNKKISQAELAKTYLVSTSTIHKAIFCLKDQLLMEEVKKNTYIITEKGYSFLEPFKVKRAILIAAGFGSRMMPITLNTPKPLVRVHNKRIIETLLDALLAKGINEIHIVRGYLGNQFDELLLKYPMIQLHTNERYKNENNISSALLVRGLYANAYVLDADLYLKNPDIIRKYEMKSNYLGVYVDKTDDWRYVQKNKKVIGMKMGGENCYQMIGLSYWTDEAGKHFQEDILNLYHQPGGKEKYWDDVPLGEFNKNYDIYIRPCSTKDIVEIDTFDELKAIDSVYAQ